MIVKDEQYTFSIDTEIEALTRQMGQNLLFGGLAGSRFYDVVTAASDWDFKLLCETSWIQFHRMGRYDFVCLGKDHVEKSIASFVDKRHVLPTALHNNGQRNDACLDAFRDDYVFSFVFEILCSRYVWNADYIREHLGDILSLVNVWLVVDYYFSRAYGNFRKFACAESIPIKKYLLMICHCLTMKRLIGNHCFFDPDFRSLLQTCSNVVVSNFAESIYTSYRYSGQTTAKNNKTVTSWLKVELDEIADTIGGEDIAQGSSIFFGNDCFLGRHIL